LSSKTAFAEGLTVYLRPLKPGDLNERYLGWLNDPEVTRYTETGVFPSTAGDLERYYRNVANSKSDVMFAIVHKRSGRHVGNVKLGSIHWIHRTATMGILIGEKAFWGKGVGLEATQLMAGYGFERLNLHRINLGVFAEHQAAVRCYERAGFKIEGRLREDLFQGGERKDRLLMGLLRSEYRPLETATIRARMARTGKLATVKRGKAK
jgi:[ribosomal protein S5]-alanine N-acetyltransferase